MRIVSVIRRKAGTDVTFDGVEYRFRPEVEGDFNSLHVAEVEREDHVQRFLAIPEGYRLHPDAFMPPKQSREAELLASVELLQAEVVDRDRRIEALDATIADLTEQLDAMTAPAPVVDPAPAPDPSESVKPPKRK